MDKKSNKLYGLVGLVVLCLISGTFAYWTQEIDVHNEFQTARYDTSVKEEFVSPENWLPGVEINKDVWLKNDGTIPVFAKVVIHQEWIRNENVTDIDGSIIPPKAGEKLPLSFESDDGSVYAAQVLWGDEVALLASGKQSDIDLGLQVVDSLDEAKGKWLLVNDEPNQNNDYILYYIGQIESEDSSPLLIDAVKMNSKIEPSILQKNTVYNEELNIWETKSELNSTYGYECAEYTMLITATTVQATEEAVKDVFGTEFDDEEIVSYLASKALDPKEF